MGGTIAIANDTPYMFHAKVLDSEGKPVDELGDISIESGQTKDVLDKGLSSTNRYTVLFRLNDSPSTSSPIVSPSDLAPSVSSYHSGGGGRGREVKAINSSARSLRALANYPSSISASRTPSPRSRSQLLQLSSFEDPVELKFSYWKLADVVKIRVTDLCKGPEKSRHLERVLQDMKILTIAVAALPGLRIADREFYGALYRSCFIANELITFLCLHQIAKDEEDALNMARVLVDAGVFVAMVPGSAFENELRFFGLNDQHWVCKRLGQMDQTINNWKDAQPLSRFHLNGENQDMDTTRLVDGWLEKKGRIGMYNMRFFRILPHKLRKDVKVIAWFRDEVSMKMKGWFTSDDILKVAVVPKKKTVEVKLTSNKKVTIRAGTTQMWFLWHSVLRGFAKSLMPEDIVRGSALGHYLDEKGSIAFAKHLKPMKIQRGATICKQGARSPYFGIISSGAIGVFVSGRESKEPVLLAQRQRFDFVGTEVFTSAPDDSRSLQALSDCTLLVLPEKNRLSLLKNNKQLQAAVGPMFHTGVDQCIEESEMFRHLNVSQRAKLKLGGRFRAVSAGNTIFHKGENADGMFLILSGECGIFGQNEQNETVCLKTLLHAETFGELTGIFNGQRRFTVKAIRNSLVIKISFSTIDSFLGFTGVSKREILGKVIQDCLQETQIGFFEELSPEELKEIAYKHCYVEVFGPKHTVFKEGDEGDAFYAVIDGHLSVSIGDEVVNRLGPLDYFGELSLVTSKATRTATLVTMGKTLMIVITKRAFRKFFARRHDLMADIELRITGTECGMRTILYHRKASKHFARFLDQNGDSTLLEFWTAAREYRHWATPLDLEGETEKIENRLKSILDKYVKSSRVSLEPSMLENIEKELKKHDVSAMTLVPAEGHVVNAMEKAHLAVFKRSCWFISLMKDIEDYETRNRSTGTLIKSARSLVPQRSSPITHSAASLSKSSMGLNKRAGAGERRQNYSYDYGDIRLRKSGSHVNVIREEKVDSFDSDEARTAHSRSGSRREMHSVASRMTQSVSRIRSGCVTPASRTPNDLSEEEDDGKQHNSNIRGVVRAARGPLPHEAEEAIAACFPYPSRNSPLK
eukprot:CAMPEP_0167776204 /NCGR_PEP_ID=MMETSP0111_2-20121227/2995_1 /TAXON_ID=91324 /ORGANISM="Lotharella globosa, Strain CCCM811" /LENGTH=1090 /DNA_ID=CAMNT_0007666225 /DNA_START=231 /DNA_END=3504 /DNA_ORIENTATION=+